MVGERREEIEQLKHQVLYDYLPEAKQVTLAHTVCLPTRNNKYSLKVTIDEYF